MVGYIRSLNRALHLNDYWIDIFKDPIFVDKKDELVPVIDNICAEQQARCAIVMHHNTSPRSDVVCILDQEIRNPCNSQEYIYLFVIAAGIALGVRPTQMWEFRVDQFKKTTQENNNPGEVFLCL